ncbi:MAG: BACON domain-containing protein [Vicinamibacterales bacterium]
MRNRHLILGCWLAVIVDGCSRNPERARVSPTAPSAMSATGAAETAGAISGPLDVFFPARNEALDFRNQLETKYQNQLRRPPTMTFVDPEGDVVWTQEYIRYRVNLCDHATAVQRVFAQIDGNAPGLVCGTFAGGPVSFPPRNEAFDFRKALETKYQDFRRGLSQTFVDPEGSVIWTQEYLRYRTNACDHPTSVRNVFTQIDGGPIAPVCAEPCRYTLSESRQSVPASGGSFEVIAFRRSGDCSWTATSESSFISLITAAGGSAQPLRYSVDPNVGAARTGIIRLDWPGGSVQLEVNQNGGPPPISFVLIDPNRSTNPTTECEIRLPATTCRLTATSNLPAPIATYHWDVTYFYGVQKFWAQSHASDTFSFIEACGQPTASNSGTVNQLFVTLRVTDTDGKVYTLESGSGIQPALTIKLFNCGP